MTRTLKIQLLAGVLALALVSVMVVRTSSAVFSGTTDTAASWDAGTVTLTDDDGAIHASANLTLTNLKPGDSGFDCIEVTYGGSLVGADLAGVKLYASSVTNTDGAAGDTNVASGKLSDDLDVTIQTLDATNWALTDCTNFLLGTSIFATAPVDNLGTSYATGHGSWAPAATNETFYYKVAWTLGTDTANDAQGDGTDVTFTWEAQSA